MKKHILDTAINKRQFIQGLAWFMGAGVSAQFTSTKALASALNFQTQHENNTHVLKLFNQDQMRCLHDICAVVLPQTDTPSASQLGVHHFIDHQLSSCFDKTQQQSAVDIVNKIEQVALAKNDKSFVKLSAEKQTQLLEQLEASQSDFDALDAAAFSLVKSLIVYGYFTTEVGATQVLAYQAVPGGFKGSIPYALVGKSYGSLAYY